MATKKKLPAKKPAPARKAAPAPKKKVGRPTAYTERLADTICALLAEDDTSLRQICQRADMPHRSTVLRWLETNADFAAKYARAREGQADVIFDGMSELEKKILAGKVGHNAGRVVLASRQWRADKLAPKKYGTKVGIGQADGMAPVSVDIKQYVLPQA